MSLDISIIAAAEAAADALGRAASSGVDAGPQRARSIQPQDPDHDFAHLQDHIQSLPPELFHLIQDSLYDILFCPGFAFPGQQDRQGTFRWKGELHKTPQPQYLTISKAVREKFERKMFSENLFVVGDGPPRSTLKFLGRGWRHPFPIRRAHIAFSYKDLGEKWAEHLPICNPNGGQPSEDDWLNSPYIK
ncbi:MAG: hypothetical protein Q9169_003110 [Polycauliona sp. 2 TL-2023]